MIINKCKICKKFDNKYKFYINRFNLCKNHFVLINLKFIILIQKIYRGYKSRRILNNIYIKLDNDTQRIIKYYLNNENKDLYKKILNKKIYNQSQIISQNYNIYNLFNNIQDYTRFIYLSEKYYDLLDYSKTKFVYCVTRDIIETIEFINDQYTIESNLLYDNNIINLNNHIYFYNNINALLIISNKFQTKFLLNNFSQKSNYNYE